MNWFVFLAAAFVPLLVGMIWYNRMAFGNTWLRLNRMSVDDAKKGNMALLFGLCYVFSLILALGLLPVVIHQSALQSIIMNDHSVEAKKWLEDSMAHYGQNFRTFKHGAFHGCLAAVFMALPILGIISLIEKRGVKYVLIHLGFWVVCFALMGGIICQWA
jgi:hypothetical protein